MPTASSSRRSSTTPSPPAYKRRPRFRCIAKTAHSSESSASRGPVPTTFDAKLQSALHAVGELCSATIERAERYDADHQFIVELSASLLGALPVMAGLETSARYLPASDTVSVGGDWFEGLLLDDHRLALVVGDVTGHGLTAAADMALLRGMITALLHSGVAVADVFSEMSGVLLQRAGLLLATAALVVVDVADATVTYATAGHPHLSCNSPPVRSDGSTRRTRR